uniref:Uncharacterized protein n=1 Tax=Utricularia reniformis TaxID=192314 RepID=A0A1Y0AZU9_9LAMI|nr:hypothetical protein AEK19_MT0442 [Utricularia reniformis]ART30706.1 hypothetical protein AEK19_MT0442 [Utricularia reniformis]
MRSVSLNKSSILVTLSCNSLLYSLNYRYALSTRLQTVSSRSQILASLTLPSPFT